MRMSHFGTWCGANTNSIDRLRCLQAFQDGSRIEAAFCKYFYRADSSQTEDSYEIIVCHANVIRYFVCRSVYYALYFCCSVVISVYF